MRLLLVELNRFRSRRAVVLALLGVVLFIGYMTAETVYDSRGNSEADIVAAQQQAEREQALVDEELERCREDPDAYFGTRDVSGLECPDYEVRYQDYLDRPTLSLEEERFDTGQAAIYFLTAIGLIAGATFAGGDWNTGSMSNQLLFRPRRGQVWLAKAAAVGLAVGLLSALVIGLQWATYYTATSVRDLAIPPGFTADLGPYLARGIALIVGASIGGYALTMLVRNTIGTLALLFFYSVGGEALIASVPIDRIGRFSLANNVSAWLNGRADVYDDSIVCPRRIDFCDQTFSISGTHGAVYLGVILALAIVTSIVLFQRRDIP